LWGRFVC